MVTELLRAAISTQYRKMGQYMRRSLTYFSFKHIKGWRGGVEIWNEGSPILLLLVDVFKLGLT